MSTFHNALYAQTGLSRREMNSRVSQALGRHGVVFEGDARGLRWNGKLGRFVADLDRELDGVASLSLAIEQTSAWECVCLDARFKSWFVEIYLMSGAKGEDPTEGLAISFPSTLHDEAAEDGHLAAQWLALLADLGTALGTVAMACGTDVLISRSGSAHLLSVAERVISKSEPESTATHTVLRADMHKVGTTAFPAGFRVYYVSTHYALATQLAFEEKTFDMLQNLR